jgi:ParB-like chromosome segregation protein Spo0J
VDKKPLGNFDLSEKLSSEVDPIIPNVGRSVEEVPLSQLDLEDDTFQTRELANLEGLVKSIEVEGQQNPVLLRLKPDKKWQIIAGFRRIGAIKQLNRQEVKTRLFDELSDEEAVKLSILDNLYQEGLNRGEIKEYQEKLRVKGILNPDIESFLQGKMEVVAISPTPEKEAEEKGAEEEKAEEEQAKEEETEEEGVIYLEDLISEVYQRLSEAARGLDQLYPYWKEVSAEEREDIITQCQYIQDLLPFLKKE